MTVRKLLARTAFFLLVAAAGAGALLAATALLKSGPVQAWSASPPWQAALPAYREVPWAGEHFKELGRQHTLFAPYAEWQLAPFAGRTITIAGGYGGRGAPPVPGRGAGRSVYFFGGGTMWGVGADDPSTIPAVVAQTGGIDAYNLAAPDFTAHQGLQLLIRLLRDGHRPSAVVFLDGYADIVAKCRSGATVFATMRESAYRARLERDVGTAGYFLDPVVDTLGRLFRADAAESYDCERDPAKARRIAAALITDWSIARQVAEQAGARFAAFLQPVLPPGAAVIGAPPGVISQARLRQVAAVYPLIEAAIARDGALHTLSGLFNADGAAFIGEADLSPDGHRKAAAAIAAALR